MRRLLHKEYIPSTAHLFDIYVSIQNHIVVSNKVARTVWTLWLCSWTGTYFVGSFTFSIPHLRVFLNLHSISTGQMDIMCPWSISYSWILTGVRYHSFVKYCFLYSFLSPWLSDSLKDDIARTRTRQYEKVSPLKWTKLKSQLTPFSWPRLWH